MSKVDRQGAWFQSYPHRIPLEQRAQAAPYPACTEALRDYSKVHFVEVPVEPACQGTTCKAKRVKPQRVKAPLGYDKKPRTISVHHCLMPSEARKLVVDLAISMGASEGVLRAKGLSKIR